jgi:hypothetical protein
MENIMRKWVYDSWNSVMDMDRNPLRHIPDLQVRHMVLARLGVDVGKLLKNDGLRFAVSNVPTVITIAASKRM